MRNISFSLTTPQFLAGAKDVTRRFGWWFLKAGDKLCAVEKAMGLKKGGKMKRLGVIEVVSVRAEPLNAITDDDCRREGFPDFTPGCFVDCSASTTLSHQRQLFLPTNDIYRH